jgi:hypothetical protein
VSELIVYRYLCPYCTNGDMGEATGRCLHCAGTGLTNDIGGWPSDQLVEAPIPPGVMRKACLDCAYRPASPEQEDGGTCLPDDEPFWCHHGTTTGYFGSHQPIGAWRPDGHPRDIPLGELICAGWWAKTTGRPLPTKPYRELDTTREETRTT